MQMFIGFYIGSLLIIILYTLHWYSVTKEISYLYYSLFKVFLIFILIQESHLIDISPVFLIININIVFLLMLLFTKEFLGLKHSFRKINLILNFAILYVFVCLGYAFLSGNFTIYVQPYSLLFSPLIFIGFYIYQKGFEPAKYFTIGWGVSLFLVGLYDLNRFSVISFYNNLPFDFIAHIIESIILSYAILIKVKFMMKEKDQQEKILIHQSRLVSLGQMLENISHQWRQPLNRVSTSIINMQMHVESKYKTELCLSEELEESQRQLEYMSNTIEDFTDFNKISKAKQKFFASDVLKNVYGIVGSTLKKNGIELEMYNDENIVFYSYKNELAHVVLNLIQNAQDILLKRNVKDPVIQVYVFKNKISVQDNAGGVNGAIVETIFEPYFTTNNKSSSLGLGLYMCRVILEKHFKARLQLSQSEKITSFDIVFLS